MLTSASAAPAAATLPLFLPQAPPDTVSGIFHAATLLAQLLGQGRALDSRALRSAMEAAFGASDAEAIAASAIAEFEKPTDAMIDAAYEAVRFDEDWAIKLAASPQQSREGNGLRADEKAQTA